MKSSKILRQLEMRPTLRSGMVLTRSRSWLAQRLVP